MSSGVVMYICHSRTRGWRVGGQPGLSNKALPQKGKERKGGEVGGDEEEIVPVRTGVDMLHSPRP